MESRDTLRVGYKKEDETDIVDDVTNWYNIADRFILLKPIG